LENAGGNLADKDIAQGTSLKPEDKTRYKEIASGVYARIDGVYIIVDSSVVSSANPVPITTDLLIDSTSGSLVTMRTIHHVVHEGKLYSVSYKAPDASPIADDGTIVLILSTGSKHAYIIASVACGGDGEIEFYENTIIAADGTPVTPQNHNRSCAVASDVTVVRDPTVNADGLYLLSKFVPGGTRNQSIGIIGTETHEWRLQIGVNYMFRLTNRAGSAQPMSITVDWHEEG